MTDGGAFFFNNSYIRNGIDLTDRSDFYIPFVLNQENPNQLFLGTYRLYRTDNARTPIAGDVRWKAISGDLTTGCTGTAPNGARNCTSPRSASAAARRSIRVRWTVSSTSAPTPRSTTTRRGPASMTTPPGAAGRGLRRRPEQLPDRLRGVQRLQRGHAGAAGPRLPHARRRQEVDRRLGQPAGHPGQLDHPRPLVREHALRRYRRRGVRELQRRDDWGRSVRASRSSPSTNSTSTRRTGCSRPALTAGCVQDLRPPAAPALVLSKVDGGKPARAVEQHQLHAHAQERGERTCDRRDDHRPGARQHELRLGGQRRHEQRRVSSPGPG